MDSEVSFRYADRKDLALILRFIKGLAEYEHMSNEVVADEKILEEWMKGRDLSGGPVCTAGIQRKGLWKGDFKEASIHCG